MEEEENNNIVTLHNPQGGNVVVLTSFDGGSVGDEDLFHTNYKEALKKVITIEEYETFKETKISYTPHALLESKNIPENFESALEGLETFGQNAGRTWVIIRGFETTEDGLMAVEMDLEEGNVTITDQINAERTRRSQED